MVDRFERFSFAISEIYRHWHRIASEEMEKYGLKGPHVVYFITMLRFPQGLTSAQLSELCSRDKADVSRAMALFEEKGFVKRSDSENRYRAVLTLTKEGREAAQKLSQRASLAVEKGGGGISKEDREIFYATLETIAVNLRSVSKEGLPNK
ncbi:MAG: hypothetical protein IJF16_03880 [Clostridia bacterium]|nr:hypothetical protein [Clostridia bacterium]